MKKVLLLLLAGFVAFGVAAKSMASARIDSMATDVREVEDLDLIWLYPNKVLDYKGTVDFRLNDTGNTGGNYPGNGPLNGAHGDSQWGGVIAEEPGLGVVGAYINRPQHLNAAANRIIGRGISTSYFTNVGFNAAADNTDTKLDLFWADKLSDMNLGVHASYSDNMFGNFQQRDIWSLGVGVGVADFGPFKEANFHADFAKTSSIFLLGNLDRRDNGIYTAKLGTLLIAEASKDVDFHVFGDVQADQFCIPTFADWNDLGVLLGFSCNHKISGGKGFVSTGFKVDYMGSESNGQIIDTWNLVWDAALETQATDWLTLRSGIVKSLVSRYYNSAASPKYGDDSGDDVRYTMGFAINWQNFTLDANISVQSFLNQLSNIQPGNGLFFGGNGISVTEADLRYKF